MQKLAANLTEKMLRRKLISPEQAEWCAYLVECKLEQVLCFSVLIALGCLIAPLWEVLLLNWGVVFLRRKANGLHLHTFAGCMLSSLCCELTALWACEKVTPAVAVLLLAISLLTLCLPRRSTMSTFILTAMKCRHCAAGCKNGWSCMQPFPALHFSCSRRHLVFFPRPLVSLPCVCFLHGWGLESP